MYKSRIHEDLQQVRRSKVKSLRWHYSIGYASFPI